MLKLALLAAAALLAGAALVVTAGPAAADPISIGTLVVTGFNALLGTSVVATTAVAGITLAQVVGSVILTAATFGLSYLASGSGKKAGQAATVDPGAAKSTFDTGTSGQLIAVGRVRIGGLKAFGNTNHADRYRLICHCKGVIDGIEEYYLGGREVIIDPDGAVASQPYTSPSGSFIYISSKTGADNEVAWSQLMTAFPNLWTAQHRVAGIAQTLIQYISPGTQNERFLKLYQSGPPELEVVLRGAKLLDPRDNVTRWSDNGILVALHVCLSMPDFSPARMDMAYIATQANLADVLVPTRSGMEKRARAWGVWDEDSRERREVLQQLLDSIGAEIIQRPGELWGIRLIDDMRPAEIAIEARDMVSLDRKYGPEGVERPNICQVKYYSPERGYTLEEINLVIDATVPAPVPLAWSRIEAEIAQVGERPVEFVFPFCPSAAQAQRLARRAFALARADSGLAVTNMVGLATWGCRVADIAMPDLDRSDRCIIGPTRPNFDDGTVEVPFVVMPMLSAWNPGLDEALPPNPIPDLTYAQDNVVPSTPTSAIVITYPVTGTAETRLAYSVPNGFPTSEVVFRTSINDIYGPWISMTEYVTPTGGNYHAWIPSSLQGQSIEFRLRVFNGAEESSIWSRKLATVPQPDNSPLPAPALSVAVVDDAGTLTATLTLAQSAALHGVGLVTTGPGNIGQVDTRPGQVFTWASVLPAPISLVSQTITWTARSITSDGTSSATVTVTATVPAGP